MRESGASLDETRFFRAIPGAERGPRAVGPSSVSAARFGRTGKSRPRHESRIDGVMVRPTSKPSGERNRVTVWPQGSFLFLTSTR